ncbi:hypothetical protein D9O40_20490 [Clostridium autoethanogenum]|uniref:Acyltransferase n=1 Tax=Clostridium autoethanogenum TaxID=84023 RepID=A0A3M0S1H1_9CLOT|nr:hypothetical protein D9O40_20490 [Clostridium autoethanogenum]
MGKGHFSSWLIFYFWGLIAKGFPDKWQKIVSRFGNRVFIIIALFLSIVEAELILRVSDNSAFATSQSKFSSYFYAFIIICIVFNKYGQSEKQTDINYKNVIDRLLIYIGDKSYAIFYLHCLFLQSISIIENRLSLQEYWVFYVMILFVFSTVLSIAVNEGLKKTFNVLHIEKYAKYLGLN